MTRLLLKVRDRGAKSNRSALAGALPRRLLGRSRSALARGSARLAPRRCATEGAQTRDPADSPMIRSLETLRTTFRARFEGADTEQALRNENAKILGKKGELTAILNQMREVPATERKAVGELVNALRKDVETAFDERLGAIKRGRRDAELNAPPFDLTLPARLQGPLGHAHPISIVRDEIVDVLVSLGFAVHDGPEVEIEENNFGKLGFPPDHPATDMQDSFWVDVRRVAEAGDARRGAEAVDRQGVDGDLRAADGPVEGASAARAPTLLRSHTSNIQVRAMTGRTPPMAFIAPGTVFRRDDD